MQSKIQAVTELVQQYLDQIRDEHASVTDGALATYIPELAGVDPSGLGLSLSLSIISGPPVPYDARPYAYGRYGYAPYINSYGIPAAVVVDPVDPATYWRQPYPYGTPYYATPYSCFYYGNC